MKRHQWVLGLICITLILTLFGSMAVAAETGEIAWLVVVCTIDFAALILFACFAPERWRE